VTFVLVHGGGFGASCWDQLVPHLNADALAVDLPGRGSHPADLTTVTLAEWAASVVSDIGALGESDARDIVLVGHSMAGLTVPRVVDLIPDRIQHLVFVSCSVPAQGESMLEVLAANFDERISSRASDAQGEGDTGDARMAEDMATTMFCNDMTPEQTAATLALMVPEAAGPLSEPADVSGLRHSVPRTWVRLTRDAILTPQTQDRFIARIRNLDVVDLDAGHMAMLSRPQELAAILNPLAKA
jgi:pimeloyl-ACP methyl ester carboxylesterase